MDSVLPPLVPHREPPWGGFASLVAHGVVLACLPLLALSRPILPPAPPPPIEVELIGPTEPEPPVAVAPPVSAAALAEGLETTRSAPEGSATEAAAPPAGPTTATQFHAARIVAENPRIAAALRTLGTDERLIQLCNIEALEQIGSARPEFSPDTLVAYAFGDMAVMGGVLTAPGAAFRSRRRWWGVALRCSVAADYSAVTAFEWTLGAEIPEAEWDAHFLTAGDREE